LFGILMAAPILIGSVSFVLIIVVWSWLTGISTRRGNSVELASRLWSPRDYYRVGFPGLRGGIRHWASRRAILGTSIGPEDEAANRERNQV
jgi:hypothetical protein